MITEKKIICGTLKEIMDHFLALIKETQKVCKDTSNILYSSNGMYQQIDKIYKENNGIGIVYYLVREDNLDQENPEINLTLKNIYIHINKETK